MTALAPAQCLLHEFRAEDRQVLCRVGGAGRWAVVCTVSAFLADPQGAARSIATALQRVHPETVPDGLCA